MLGYIYSESRRFHIYVANTVHTIRETTDPKQWHHISGACNLADILSRKCEVSSLNETWWSGPPFLKQFKDQWNVDISDWSVSPDDPEVNNICYRTIRHVNQHPIDYLCKYFSDWKRLIRAVAWLLKMKTARKKKLHIKGNMDLGTLLEAELLIIKYAQELHFTAESASIRTRGFPMSSRSIRALLPQLEGDVLVVGGCMPYADLDERLKYPIIIPYDQRCRL